MSIGLNDPEGLVEAELTLDAGGKLNVVRIDVWHRGGKDMSLQQILDAVSDVLLGCGDFGQDMPPQKYYDS